MKELLSDIQFAKPLFLWLLLGLPLLWLRIRDQRLLVILGRTVILLLLIFGLADPQWVTRQAREEERIFAFDLSQSITTSMRHWMETMARGEACSRAAGIASSFSPRLQRKPQTGANGSRRTAPTPDSIQPTKDQPGKIVHYLAGSPRRAAKPLFVHRRLGNPRERGAFVTRNRSFGAQDFPDCSRRSNPRSTM